LEKQFYNLKHMDNGMIELLQDYDSLLKGICNTSESVIGRVGNRSNTPVNQFKSKMWSYFSKLNRSDQQQQQQQ
jgi:hypothetical protein